MERLRAAIEQARKTRADAAVDAPPTPSATVKVIERTPDEAAEMARENMATRWAGFQQFIPKARKMRRSRLVSESSKADQAPYDLLRTRLLAQMRKNNWKRIAVTSPDMACGKSTTSANLALAMSRHGDMRTLLIEADLRRPSLAKMFGIKGDKSFHDVLRGNVSFADQAVRIGSNVGVSVNYSVARDPAELLHRQQTAEVLAAIEAEYQPDLILFDMPPLLNSDDTLGFVGNIDAALIVAMAEKTTAENIDLCETELAAHTEVAGIVLNRCRYGQGQYGYGYGEY